MGKAPRAPTGGDVLAAGGIVWRRVARSRCVAVVHRPAYNDWSLPKGKLDPGETLLEAAVREVREETGCAARPVRFLGALTYPVSEGQKYVLWWAMAFEAEVQAPAEREIGALRWLTVTEALRLLT